MRGSAASLMGRLAPGTTERAVLDQIYSVEAMRRAAERALPRAIFDSVDGGAAGEVTVRENQAAFDRVWLRPRTLADVGSVRLDTTVLGRPISMPVMLGPCGALHRVNRAAELGVARAAARAGTVYAVHNAPAYPVELLAESAPGLLWGQVYLPSERAVTRDVIERLERAAVDVLVLTIDSPVAGRRDRNLRNRYTRPGDVAPSRIRLARAGIRHPRWTLDVIRGRRATRRLHTPDRPMHQDHAHARPVTAEDVEWLRREWKGALVIKGVQRGEECERLVELGVDAVVVSNHGGRHLDGTRPTIETLPEVVEAIAGRAEVYLDSGVRRGTDVVKALALGARAVFVGRPYVFALGVGGEAGVDRLLGLLRSELRETMALSGCPTIEDIDRSVAGVPLA